jgi:hypothetical protein
MDHPLRARIEAELDYAARARAHGKEGRARVCARRAAGWAVGAYRRRQSGGPEQAALAHLRWLRAASDQPETLRLAASRLLAQVDRDHRLPHPEDPLQDARLIIQAYLEPLDPALHSKR